MNTRIIALQEQMQQLNLDSFLVTTPKNIRYLSGFTGTTATLLITLDSAYFITDFRYDQQAHQQATDFEVIIHQSTMYDAAQHVLVTNHSKRTGFEADHVTMSLYHTLNELFDSELVSTQGVIEKIREVKDPSEIKAIKQAAKIMDEAYKHILAWIQPGMTEIEVANEIERFCKRYGSTGMSFDTIVASGYRSAMPHGVASSKEILTGDIVTLDFGCYYDGYTADMTRTFAIDSIDPGLREIYQIVYDANRLVSEQARAGITGHDLDAVARDYISAKGYGDHFGHSTGHSIGLDIHEKPMVSWVNDQPLAVGNVITNEPGIYIEGLGGVRIEDDLILTANGNEIINQSTRELIIL